MSNDKDTSAGGGADRKPIDLGVEPHPEPEGTDMGEIPECTKSNGTCKRNSKPWTDDD